MIRPVLCCLMAAALLVGCSAPPVQQVALNQPMGAPMDAKTRIIQFRKATDLLPKGDPIGKTRFGALCIPGKALAWRDGRVNLTDDELAESFRKEVEKAKFAVLAEPGPMLEAPVNSKTEYVVSAQLLKLNVDACSPWSDFGNWRDAKGGAYVKVQWQVYNVAQRKAMFEAVSEGSFQTDESVEGGLNELIRNAFGAATQNLLADTSFYRAIHGEPKAKPQAVGPMTVDAVRTIEQNKAEQASTEPKTAVFTVIAGANRGTGFVVSTDGYLITNERTVRDTQLVKLKSASGRESLGFVVRRDPQNDLALVKLTERSTASLAMRPAPVVAAGEEVYVLDPMVARPPDVGMRRGVIGPAKDAAASGLVRTTVPITPLDAGAPFFDKNGKVVGVAVWPASEGGAQSVAGGFIPIAVAMERLALNLK